MTSLETIGLVAIILLSAFAVVGIIVAIPIVKLLNRLRSLVEKLNVSLVPMIEKLNNTVTHLNSEISSISNLTQIVSSIVEQFEKIIKLARVVITTPIIKVISTGAVLASSIKKLQTKSKK